MPSGGPVSNENMLKILAEIRDATRAAPALTGGHLGQALNGAARTGAGAARWNSR